MKKILHFLPLALVILLISCAKEYEDYMDLSGSTNDGSLSYRLYIEPFAGQWTFFSYDIFTKTFVHDGNESLCDIIQGRDFREIVASWNFETDGWGTIALAKKPPYIPGSETPLPNDNISPLLKYGKEFQWKVDNDSTMRLTFYLTNDSTETYEARYIWENLRENNLDMGDTEKKKNPYLNDYLSLTIQYTTKGDYAELENTYAGYTTNNVRYDGTDCTFETNVLLTYYLQRN